MKHNSLSYTVWDKISTIVKWHLNPKITKQCMQYIQNSKLKNLHYMWSASDIFHVVPLYLKEKDADKRSHQIFTLSERLTPARKI